VVPLWKLWGQVPPNGCYSPNRDEPFVQFLACLTLVLGVDGNRASATFIETSKCFGKLLWYSCFPDVLLAHKRRMPRAVHHMNATRIIWRNTGASVWVGWTTSPPRKEPDLSLSLLFAKLLIPGTSKVGPKRLALGYPQSMAENLVELAQKMAEAARAGVAIEKKRLQEILVERQKKSASSSSSSK
jgi:hypothetical protein